MNTKVFKKAKLLLRLLALLAVLGLLLEAGLSAAAAKNAAESSITEYSVEDMRLVEFRKEPDGSYYALANNGSFILELAEPRDVKEVRLDFSVEETSPTEKVLYYTGVKDGVQGEFVSALKRTEGGYTAAIDAESVSCIRVFPTEQTRSTVNFRGLSLVAGGSEGINLGRALTFMLGLPALLVWAERIVAAIRGKKSCFGTLFSVWIGLASLVGLVAMAAVRLFTAASGIGGILVPLGIVGFSAAFFFCYALAFKVQKLHNKVFWLLLAAGLAFSFITVPLQVPDESIHFLRAFAMAEGDFTFNFNRLYPGDAALVMELFPGEFYNNIHEKELGTAISRLGDYLRSWLDAKDTMVELYCPVQILWPYLLPAAAMALARLASGSALLCLYVGRAVNAIVFAICARAALRRARRYRIPLAAMLLLPLTVFMTSSLSYDSMFFSCLALFLGTVLGEEMDRRKLATAAISFGLMVSIKPVYLPLILLLLLMPWARWKNIKKPAAAAAFVGSAAVFYLGALLYAGFAVRGVAADTSGALWGVDYLAQALHLLRAPMRYATTLGVDGYLKSFYIGDFGLFGALDVELPLTALLTPITVVVLAAMTPNRVKDAGHGETALLLGLTAVMYVIIVTSFYVSWSTLGATSVLGVQARYFIPSVFLFAAGISRVFSKVLSPVLNRRSGEAVAFGLSGGLLVLAAVELALAYYLM